MSMNRKTAAARNTGFADTTTSPPELEFPGCKPVPMTTEQVVNYEGRLEFWDAKRATAWMVCEPTTAYHERPGQKLAILGDRIAQVRGSPIVTFGTTDLLVPGKDGKPRHIMQADQSTYLHPKRASLPGKAIVVGETDLPDVVLEVDHTTDVRRSKLLIYESWGFPEVWVEVPDQRAPSRPRSRLPGLTIHVLENGTYRQVAESRAFPSWTVAEIHAAMNEETPSAETNKVLERVGKVLGTREGTGPDGDPLARSQRRQGFERGQAEGVGKGRLEMGTETAQEILLSRGIEVSGNFAAALSQIGEMSGQAIVAAAHACTSETDFLNRLR